MANSQQNQFLFEVGDGTSGFLSANSVWPQKKFGTLLSSPTNVKLINDALRDRQLILVKKRTGKNVGMTILNKTLLAKTLYIPFIIIDDTLNKIEKTKALNEILNLIASFVENSDINKILFYKDFNKDSAKVEKSLNQKLKAENINAEIKISEKLSDFFGDKRDIMPVTIFIDNTQRPNLTARRATQRNLGGILRPVLGFTSSCKEDTKTGKDVKDKEKEKEKDDGSFRQNFGVRPGGDFYDSELMLLYSKLGITTVGGSIDTDISFI